MRPIIPKRSDFNYWTTEKLRNADTDQFQHVNNAVLASFFESGRMGVFTEENVKALMGSTNIAVVQLLINFHRELFYPGEASIGTLIKNISERSIAFAQGIFIDDDCIASAEAICVLLDPLSSRASIINEGLRQLLLGKNI